MPHAPPTPLFGERALHLPADDALVVGDLHVGLEAELREAGIHLPSQSWRMRARLDKLLKAAGAQKLIVLGDLKHAIPTATRDEHMDLPAFFDGLDAEVHLVRGNHDVDLDVLPPEVVVHAADGMRLGAVGLVHGHTWPADDVMAAPLVVMCHNHPMVLLKDELGHRHKEACWIRAALTDAARARYPRLPLDATLVVMPAFNELLGGVAFNGPDRPLGPIFANGLADLEAARVWTLDGVDLGSVADLRAWGDARGEDASRPRRRRRARGRS